MPHEFIHQLQSGAAIDTRPESEKEKDFQFAEIVANANPVNWVEKTQIQWRKFPIFNQDSSGSCVAQTEAKELGIMRWLKDKNYVHFSATDIYQRRSNKPNTGMGAVDARNIIKIDGATLESLTPSQGMTDQQMDDEIVETYKREVGRIFAVPNFLTLPIKSIDTVASVIQTTGKGVMLWFYFEYREWTDHPVIMNPNINLNVDTTVRHSLTGIDFALINGKKSIIIEDSWGPNFGFAGQRVIDEDFFIARNWYAGYLVNFKFTDQTAPIPPPIIIPKPIHLFNKDLAFKPPEQYSTDIDVVALQDILKYEGLFPSNTSSSGYFGAITAKSVLSWQKKHVVAPNSELDPLGGKFIGPKTRAVLNSLYGQ